MIKHGDLIIASEPFAYVLFDDFRAHRCEYCFKKNLDLKRCIQCSFLYFCDKKCQAKGWKQHKMECKYIMKAMQKPTASMRFISLILLKIKKFGEAEPYEDVLGCRRTFKSLMSHAKVILKTPKLFEVMGALMASLNMYIGPANITDPEEFAEVFGKMKINSFNIIDDGDMKPIGFGLYLGASIFDHSCKPTAEFVFDGATLCVRANQDILQPNVKKVTISYIERMQLTEERQAQLEKNYLFPCKCLMCVSPQYNNIMKKTFPGKNHDEEINKAKQGLKHVEEMIKENVDPSILNDACVEQLQSLNESLLFFNVYKNKVIQIAFECSVTLKNWGDAMLLGKLLLDPFRFYYGPHSKVVGLQLFKLGKITLYYGSSSEAKSYLHEAENILRKTHGTNHAIYHDLIEVLKESKQ